MSLRTLLWLVFTLVLFASCKKENLVEITGSVSEFYQDSPIAGADLEFSYAELGNGFYSTGYTQLGNVTTGSQGGFSFQFQNVQAVNYRVRIRKDGFIFHEELIDTDDWNIGENRFDAKLFQEAIINYRFFNTDDPNAQVLFSLGSHSENCESCCGFIDPISIIGIKDTSFSCAVYANQNITYRINSISNSTSNVQQGFIEVKAGENVFELEY